MSHPGDGGRDSDKKTSPNAPEKGGSGGPRRPQASTAPRRGGETSEQGGTSQLPSGAIMYPEWPTFGVRQQQINYPSGYGLSPSAFTPFQPGTGSSALPGQYSTHVGSGGSIGGSSSGAKRGPDVSISDTKRQQVVVGRENAPTNIPPRPPPPPLHKCHVCGRWFQSKKGLFGHMRCHKDRPWKGAYPPPKFSRDEFEGVLGVAAEAEAAVTDQTAVVEAATVGGETGGDSLTPGEEVGGAGAGQALGESSSTAERGGRVWDRDLNKSPPTDSDEEEK